MPMQHNSRLLMLSWLLALCAGCGSSADTDTAAATSGSRKTVSPEAVRLAATMVKAVSPGGGDSAVDVKFEVTQRPEVGKPVDISIAMIPTSRLERLYARFQTGDDLELVKGEATEQISRPVIGAPIMHTVTITPRRDGIFTVTAIVLMDSESDSVSRNFSIPLIAGSGLPAWTPKQAVASAAQ
jgi:hypothetical protein